MRIVAGKYRGRKLVCPAGLQVRPTPDRVKESLFQILEPRLKGARVLDLFAGSGALGLEALSRGAAEVVFNDVSPTSRETLFHNLRLVGETAKVYGLGFEACLKTLSAPFGVVFCDPPYREDYAEELMRLVGECGLLSEGGVVIYESEREERAPEGWKTADTRRYGRTKIFFFERDGI